MLYGAICVGYKEVWRERERERARVKRDISAAQQKSGPDGKARRYTMKKKKKKKPHLEKETKTIECSRSPCSERVALASSGC